MGLLDDLLGGLAGHGMRGPAQGEPARAGGGGSGTSQVLMALMPIVLGMLENRGARASSPTRGGIGDLLGQVLGGGGGGMGGGLGGLLEQLQRTGFGDQADSWVSRDANKPISPGAMS